MAIYNVGRDIDNRELGIGNWASGIGNCELEVETKKATMPSFKRRTTNPDKINN